MPKYIFADGGQTDETGAAMFNQYADQAIADQSQNDPLDEVVPTEPDESDFIKGLRASEETASDADMYKELLDRVDSLQSKLDERLNSNTQNQQEIDWFGDDNNKDELAAAYNTQETSAGDFSGIFKNEGAKTGQPTSLNSSAIGRGQMVRGTRHAMYKKLGITDITQAEQKFKTDPAFEMKILNAYKDELGARIPEHIQGKQRDYMIAKGWYTGNPNYPDNQVPGKSAGNKLTAGEYARRAINS